MHIHVATRVLTHFFARSFLRYDAKNFMLVIFVMPSFLALRHAMPRFAVCCHFASAMPFRSLN